MKPKEKQPSGRDAKKVTSHEKEISDNIINHSRSMISVINKDYIYEKVNLAFCNAHNITIDQIVGKSLADIWGTQTFYDFIKNNIDRCFSGETIKYEASFETPGYGVRYFEVTFRPLNIEGNGITYLLAETFDIHDTKQREIEIREKEQELKKLATNLPIGIVRCLPDGSIIHANRAFLDIMDCYDENSIKKANFRSFYPQDFLFDIQCEQLLEKHIVNFGRVSLHDCIGKEISCRISGFLAFDSTSTNSFLDFVVEDATRELMLENRLIQAQKLETIGALAGGIAHDFNNILTTISGYSELIMEDLPQNSEISEKVSKIQGAVLRAKSITNQILTFSRQVEQDKIAVSVGEVLSETMGFIKSSIPSNIVVQSKFFQNDVKVLADPTQLFRVFINLMTNAIQAMEEHGGTLSVTMEVIEGKLVKNQLNKDIVADEYVFITFKDTGKGMEPSVLSRIFEPFFTTREIGKGTGLGLSVTYGIISEMEGEILVSSKREEGSEFFVYLPVARQYIVNEIFTGPKKKILFIAGNKHESRMLSMALENTGFDLLYVSDRQGFVKAFSSGENNPDLIIYMTESGQVKPEDFMNIYLQNKADAPCIIITNQNCSIFEEKLLNSGIVKQHLVKPVSLKEIKSAIQLSV
ncbi:MAG: PAS domain-containing protein [Bacteroidetes bacterium]|nr:PAS domain-containing protein [Bacteroidota bacterium]